MNVQILMKYTERYERIPDQFPLEALTARFDRQVFSISISVPEEYFLTRHRYLSESLLQIWEGDLKKIIGSPHLQTERPSTGGGFYPIKISWST
jgi:hypothetical protein